LTSLAVDDLEVRYGAVRAVRGLSFTVEPGEIVGLIGPNGAGKSSTLHAIMGVAPVTGGNVTLGGASLLGRRPEDVARSGIALVPEGRRIFAELTVEENLRLGAYTLRRRSKGRYAAALDGVYDRFPVLRDRRNQQAGTMSGGQQASLAVGRALINEPQLILVDEPSAGLSPVATLELDAVLQEVARSGVTMVLVEQNIAFGLSLVDTAHLLQTGTVVHSGPVAELDDQTLATHLGIGRVLQAAAGSALAARQSTAKEGSPRGRRTA
jgi:branched-chain amino acid transport system ATP-binding protein